MTNSSTAQDPWKTKIIIVEFTPTPKSCLALIVRMSRKDVLKAVFIRQPGLAPDPYEDSRMYSGVGVGETSQLEYKAISVIFPGKR